MATVNERLEKIARNVHSLIQLRKESGFQTRRAVVDLLRDLSGEELLEVSKLVAAMAAAQGVTHGNSNQR